MTGPSGPRVPTSNPVVPLTPSDIATQVSHLAIRRAALSFGSMSVLAAMAGVFVALGAMLTSTISASSNLGLGPTRLLMGIGLSTGLFLVVITGAELFTGNNLMVIGLLDHQITVRQLIRNWISVYLGNFIGALAVVLVVFWSRWWEIADFSFGAAALTNAHAKIDLGLGTVFARGILANVFVCLALWLATAGRSLIDKLVAVVLPISAFVAGGFEHSVADMYFVPIGMLVSGQPEVAEAAQLSSAQLDGLSGAWFAGFLAIVTLGNVVGGVAVSLANWFVHLRRIPTVG
ncbi:formate/nitrite transporter family protein [Candidatus Poriferisodalis sp.]|uniref:formate/nitrite transporter family protein n=1 Tax=Candidatus Poriferisodalis sp. TaxID=3101277 RepID=UPI003B0176A4